MSWSYCKSGTKAALRKDIIKQAGGQTDDSFGPSAAALLLPLLQPDPNESGIYELDAGGHCGKAYKLHLRSLSEFVTV